MTLPESEDFYDSMHILCLDLKCQSSCFCGNMGEKYNCSTYSLILETTQTQPGKTKQNKGEKKNPL